MTEQTDLEEFGAEIPDKYKFNCPICDKQFDLKTDHKGNVYHRPWIFHIAGDHGEYLLKHHKALINVLIYYFCYHDQPAGQEIRDRINSKKVEA